MDDYEDVEVDKLWVSCSPGALLHPDSASSSLLAQVSIYRLLLTTSYFVLTA
jgi:hypothetical protein